MKNDNCCVIDPISVLYFNLEHSEFPLSVISFESDSAPTTYMERWAKHSIKYLGNVLDEAQVLSAIHSSIDLSITRDNQLFSVLLPQWSTETRTFVAS